MFSLCFDNFSPAPLSQLPTLNDILSWSHLLIALTLSNYCHQVLLQAIPSSKTFTLPQPAKFLPSISVPKNYSLPQKVLIRSSFAFSIQELNKHLPTFPTPLLRHSILWQSTRCLLFMKLFKLCPVACTFLLPIPFYTVPQTTWNQRLTVIIHLQ